MIDVYVDDGRGVEEDWLRALLETIVAGWPHERKPFTTFPIICRSDYTLAEERTK